MECRRWRSTAVREEREGDKWGGKGGRVKGIQTVEKYKGVGGTSSIKRREGKEGGISGEGKGVG